MPRHSKQIVSSKPTACAATTDTKRLRRHEMTRKVRTFKDYICYNVCMKENILCAKEVYEILHRWTRRRLDNMANRFIIMKRRGFRLYQDSMDEIYNSPIDVPSDSQLEKRCQRVMIKAISFIFQNDKYIIRDDATNEVINFHWMPEGLWRKFENKINELTKEEL